MKNERKILLLVPRGACGVSDTVWEQLRKLQNADSILKIIDFDLQDMISGDEKKDPRDKAGGKARFLMHEMEIELIHTTDYLRNEGNWLILDGAGNGVIRCRKCRQMICEAGEKYKEFMPMAEYPLTRACPRNSKTERFVLREFYCPSCVTLVDVEMALRGSPLVHSYRVSS